MLKRNKTFIFLIMILVLSLGQITSDIYLPSLPAIAFDLHASARATQFTLAIYMFGFAISQLFYGPVSDGIGRRKPLLFGLMLCLIGSLICFNARGIEFIIVGRLIQGLGAGATLTLSSAVVRDLYEGENLAKHGSYSALIGVAMLTFAPLFGGYIEEFAGWRANFLVMLSYTLFALLIIFFWVPETNMHQHPDNLLPRHIKKNLSIILTSPIFIGYCSCSLLVYGAILAWLTAGPFLLQKVVGLTPVGFGWAYIFTGVAFAAGALLNSRYVMRYGINKMLLTGLCIVLLAGTSMAVFKLAGFINSVVIIGPVMLLLFGASLVFPNASAGIFHPFPKIAGIASAIFYSTRMLGGAVFSGVLAYMPDNDQLPMACAVMVSAILSLILFSLTIRRLKPN